jgi:hypothetical protein
MGHEEKGSKWSKGTKGTKFWLDMESKFWNLLCSKMTNSQSWCIVGFKITKRGYFKYIITKNVK